jgi:hypothetical protein
MFGAMSALYVHPSSSVHRPSTQRGVYIFLNKKTDAVKRWLKAISLSVFGNFVPPLIDKNFQLFVQFFWFIKVAGRSKANKLLSDARRQWGLEPGFYEYYFNRYLESGDDTAFAAFAASTRDRHSTGQALRSTGKGVSKISVL